MIQLEFNGEIIEVPEADADWFIKEKGAKPKKRVDRKPEQVKKSNTNAKK